MVLYALEDVDDALALTRRFLTPVDRTRWLKLALIVSFVGGPGANVNTFQYSFGGDGGGFQAPPGGVPFDPGVGFWTVVAAVVLVALLVGLAFLLVGSIMEFVLVESLRNEEVAIRQYWGRRWRQGVRLLGFRVVIGLLVLGSVLLLAAPFLLAAFGDGVDPAAWLALLVVLVPLFVVLSIVVGLVNGFTTVFVVPVMVLEDGGVLDGWRRLWPTVTDQWTQYAAYAVAGFVLSIVGGFVVAMAVFLGALVLLIPFGLLAAIAFLALLAVEPVGIALFVVLAVLFGLAIVAVAALALVPVQTYLRYYALLVLGDVDPDLDLVADQRAALRE